MSEQVGVTKIGSVSYPDEIFANTVAAEIVSVVMAGGAAASYSKGLGLINGGDGLKVAYANATEVTAEAVGTGDAATTTFDLVQSDVIESSLVVYIGNDKQRVTLSAGTGAAGVDQIVFSTAPASGVSIVADYYYHGSSVGVTGASILLDDVTTTVAGGNIDANAAVGGTVKTAKILDSAGAEVDTFFRDALTNVRFA